MTQNYNTIYKYGRAINYAGTTTIFDNPGYDFRAVDWYPDIAEAIIVGGTGEIFRHVGNTDYLLPIENPFALPYNAVCCKGASSPAYAIAMGAAGEGARINQISAGSAVTVTVQAPSVSYIEFQDKNGMTKTNQQVDVDAGTGTTYYDIETRVGYAAGYMNIDTVDAYMWYDDYNVGSAADYPALMGASFDNPSFGNRRAHFQWTRATNAWNQLAPVEGPGEETTLDEASCFPTYDVDGENVTLRFRFSPHQQIWAANGPFTQGPGTQYRYDDNGNFLWDPKDQSTVDALDDANTWNIKIVATAGAETGAAYDEFGIFTYTYISSAGLPGPLAGSGPPSTIIPLTPVGTVVYSANYWYRIEAYVDSDFVGQGTGGSISASTLWVQGGDFAGGWFAGPGSANAQYIMGDSGSWCFPQGWGRTTDTSIGAEGDITWYCNIPAASEDVYTTSITYVLTHQ